MTQREDDIVGHVLAWLADWRGMADEALIHAAIQGKVQPRVMLGEFQDIMALCETNGWVTGVNNPRSGNRWTITDFGRAQKRL